MLFNCLRQLWRDILHSICYILNFDPSEIYFYFEQQFIRLHNKEINTEQVISFKRTVNLRKNCMLLWGNKCVFYIFYQSSERCIYWSITGAMINEFFLLYFININCIIRDYYYMLRWVTINYLSEISVSEYFIMLRINFNCSCNQV